MTERMIDSLKTVTALFLVSGMFFTLGCGNSNNPDGQRPEHGQVQADAESKKHQYPMPTPLETAEMLNKAGASYILDITNPPENTGNYLSESSMALNLGVYGTDLSYSAVYNKTQQTLDFFEASKKLVSGMNIEAAFSSSLGDRIESNIENPDSIHQLLTGSFEGTYAYLLNQDKGPLAIMVLAGGWIEGLYLSTELSQITAKNEEILQGIGEQRETLKKLTELLQKYAGDHTIDNLISSLSDIAHTLSEVEMEEGRYKFTEEQLSEVSVAIQSLRIRVIGTP